MLGGRRVAEARQKIGNGIRLHNSPNSLLPTRFHDARNFSTERHAAKTDAAHLELADIAARAAANAAAVAHANLEFGLLARLGDFCGPCHGLSRSSFPQGNAEAFQQLAALLIVFR